MSGGPLSCFSKQGILLLSVLHYGTWAEDRPIDQYGLKGGSVCLAVAEPPEELKGFSWKVNSTVIVDDKEISPKYKEKVDYNPVNQTLCIKNLTDTDSGIYIANAKKIDWTDSTSSYRLKVLEAVPIPAMQVTYYNSSTGLCTITVNCSGWKFSVCDGGQCPLYQDSLSVSEVNITVSSGNGFIQCIVNNHVSAETKSQRMKNICIGEKKGIAAASLVGIIVGIVTGGLFLVGVGCIISTRRWRSPKEKLLLKAVVPEVDNPVSTIPGRPEPQNTPGSEVTSIYVTAGRPELQNTPGSEVTSIYVTAGRPELQNTPGSEVTSIYVTAGRPELQNTPGSEVTSIYVTAGRPELQNTPGSEVTSIYVTAGRPELQNTPGSEVTSIYITAGRPELQNTPGSEVTSIYVTAGRRGAVPAAAEGEEGHPGDTEHTSPEERKEPQSPLQAETFYSTLQIPAAAQRHPVGKGNNLKKPDTVYCTIGDKLPY
ncbi:uncharacterized protein ACWYII_030818 isoform 1-T1 [Salvelinus alpinus]